MADNLSTEYKGHNIWFDQSTDNWVLESNLFKHPQLSVVKKYVDNIDRKDFTKIDVIELRGFSERMTIASFLPAFVTSINPTARDFWVSYKKAEGFRSREKKRFGDDSVYLDTPENRKLFADAVEIQKQANALCKQANSILKKMVTFNPHKVPKGGTKP